MKKILQGLLIFDLIAINIAAGYLIYRSLTNQAKNINEVTTLPAPLTTLTGEQGGCDEICQKNINDRLNNMLVRIGSLEAKEGITPVPTAKAVVQTKTLAKPKVKTTQYVTIPGSGSSAKSSWESLLGTDFYFDTADYPGLLEVYFEATVKLFNGNGMAYIRLYDENHTIGVQGSEVSTNSQAGEVVVSGRVSFWAGRNLIRVQAKSLTADTAIFSYGRLKIITEN